MISFVGKYFGDFMYSVICTRLKYIHIVICITYFVGGRQTEKERGNRK